MLISQKKFTNSAQIVTRLKHLASSLIGDFFPIYFPVAQIRHSAHARVDRGRLLKYVERG